MTLCQKYCQFCLLSISADDWQMVALMSITINRQKTTLLWLNGGAAAS